MSDNLTPEDRALVDKLRAKQIPMTQAEVAARIESLSDDLAGQTKLAALADKAIEDAPHDRYCGLVRAQQRTQDCNCFKADYAKAKGELL